MKHFIFVFALSVAVEFAWCQSYPVQVTTILQPPYSLQLSDYTSPDFEAIRVSIFLRELDRHEYKVKLRLTIHGQSVTLVTKENYLPRPLFLQGGMTEFLSGADIASYFNLDNLDVFGNVNKGDLYQRGRLPEGFYTFTIEVLDYNRSVVVSNKGEASAFLILNDPPIINLPINGDKLIATDPQNVMFSWTPRNLVSPNSAFSTEYEFSLVELNPVDRNPNDAIQSSNTIYTLKTTDTGLNYGVAEPMLIPGRRYAFRVRAVDTSGRDMFKNDGYSEVFVFQYGDACVAPTGLKGTALDDKRISVEWKDEINHTGYTIFYKLHDREQWYLQDEPYWRGIIQQLIPNLELDIRVKAKCGSLLSDFTEIITVKTNGIPAEKICVKPVEATPVPECDSVWLQEELKPGDVITNNVHRYQMVTVQRRPDGTYNGTAKGEAMEFVGFGKPNYIVRAVRLSRKYEIIGGRVSTVHNLKWTRTPPERAEASEKKKEAEQSKALAVAEIKIDGEIKTVSIDSVSGEIVMELQNGETKRQARPTNDDPKKTLKDVRITDSRGDVWTVGADGKIMEFPRGPAGGAITNGSGVAKPQSSFDSLLITVTNESKQFHKKLADSLDAIFSKAQNSVTDKLRTNGYDEFLYSGPDHKYVSRGMSKLFKPANPERLKRASPIDVSFYQLYLIDRELQSRLKAVERLSYHLTESAFTEWRQSISQQIDLEPFNSKTLSDKKKVLTEVIESNIQNELK